MSAKQWVVIIKSQHTKKQQAGTNSLSLLSSLLFFPGLILAMAHGCPISGNEELKVLWKNAWVAHLLQREKAPIVEKALHKVLA